MPCCLNSACHNPTVADGTQFCPNCGVPIKLLGGGGLGKTYLAKDVDHLSQRFVLKQLAPQA
jgi:hypothetical protein